MRLSYDSLLTGFYRSLRVPFSSVSRSSFALHTEFVAIENCYTEVHFAYHTSGGLFKYNMLLSLYFVGDLQAVQKYPNLYFPKFYLGVICRSVDIIYIFIGAACLMPYPTLVRAVFFI